MRVADLRRLRLSKTMKFSIVTPSFGQLDWLELCLASVADQGGGRAEAGDLSLSNGQAEPADSGREPEVSEFSIEHIVCDAGSEGIEVFKNRMLERFPQTPHYRLEFLIGPDAGMYDAINKGLSRATGDICSYLNCDEQLLPGALERVDRRLAGEPQVDVLFGDAVVVDGDG